MKKLGFTLAEVLITLVIIGVIAAMTVPTLMNNTQGQENKTAFKKAISSMNQALTMEYALEGNTAATATATVGTSGDWKGLAAVMTKRTNVITVITDSLGGTTPDGISTGTMRTFSTADGLIYVIPEVTVAACAGDATFDGTKYPDDNCGVGWVDVNGQKGPNVKVSSASKPQDRFAFTIYETKVLPGTKPDSVEAQVMYEKKDVKQEEGGTDTNG